MQIIPRRVNQGVVIGAETQITVLEIDRDSVELEIRNLNGGPDSRRVVRLYLESDDENEFLNDDSHQQLSVLAGAR